MNKKKKKSCKIDDTYFDARIRSLHQFFLEYTMFIVFGQFCSRTSIFSESIDMVLKSSTYNWPCENTLVLGVFIFV